MIGEIINGKYKIESVFAESRMYELFTATEGKTGATVIMKLLKEEIAIDPGRIKCFSEEISSFARLSHPSVAEILDVDVYDERPYVITPVVEGVELNEVIKSRELSFASCVRIIKELALVLQYAFEQNIEYRTIKLSNVLLNSAGKITVLSFTRPRLRLAAAPSQNTHSGIHADLFFLGGTFFELLSGESIIRKRGGIHELWDMKLESKMRIRHQELTPEQISKTVGLIKKALTRNIKQRFESHDEFLKALSVAERFVKARTAQSKPNVLSMASQVVDAINGRIISLGTAEAQTSPNGLKTAAAQANPNGLKTATAQASPNALKRAAAQASSNGLKTATAQASPNGLKTATAKSTSRISDLTKYSNRNNQQNNSNSGQTVGNLALMPQCEPLQTKSQAAPKQKTAGKKPLLHLVKPVQTANNTLKAAQTANNEVKASQTAKNVIKAVQTAKNAVKAAQTAKNIKKLNGTKTKNANDVLNSRLGISAKNCGESGKMPVIIIGIALVVMVSLILFW